MCGGKNDWVVIGVSGVTCGGKTTFAKALHTEFPEAIILHQDVYFLEPNDSRHTVFANLNHVNWEIPSSLDMDRMKNDIREILTRPPPDLPLLIIEGFLIFVDSYISSVCQHKVFFTMTKEECWIRRSVRTYDPPDVPGYFEQVVWPEYERNLELALAINSDLDIVPGTVDISLLVANIKVTLNNKLKKVSQK